MSTIQNVEVIRKNSKVFQVTLYTDATKTVKVPIANYEFFFTVKDTFGVNDGAAKIAKDPADWVIIDDTAQLIVGDSDNDLVAAEYKYDIKYVTDAGLSYTFVRGTYDIKNYVTQRNT